MRAQTIFSTTAKTGELQPEFKVKLRRWMRDHKEYGNSPTLDPKVVCERAENESDMFYQHLSWDAHPSIESLNRYYEQPDANGAPGVDVSPVVRDAEVIEMLNLMCLGVMTVFLGVVEILGQDSTAIQKIAADYAAFTQHTGERAFRNVPPMGRPHDVKQPAATRPPQRPRGSTFAAAAWSPAKSGRLDAITAA